MKSIACTKTKKILDELFNILYFQKIKIANIVSKENWDSLYEENERKQSTYWNIWTSK